MPPAQRLSPSPTFEFYPIQKCLIRGFLAGFAALAASALLAPNICAANNPVPFVDIVAPVTITPGSTSNSITVRGTGFISGSLVLWNGTSLVVTSQSSTALTAMVPDALVAAVGLGSVVVMNPIPGGGKSNVWFVPVAVSELSTTFPSSANSTVTVGNTPQGIVTADFNGDGNLDLAVANNGDGTVSILLGNGHGGFTLQSTPTAGTGANWLAVGDFDGDGVPDLAVANFGSTGTAGVSILTQNVSNGVGTGSFTLKSSLATGRAPFAIVTGDFDGDGFLDLAVSNSADGTITIWYGSGGGTFVSGGAPLTVGGNPQVIVAGDFNGDGKLDLAVSNENDDTVSVLLGNGTNRTFQTQATYSTGSGGMQYPLGLITADLKNEGALDLMAVNTSNVAILLHNGSGDGTFTLQPSPPTAGTVLIAGVAGDYNGDGKLDIVVSDTSLGEAFLFTGKGDGTFNSPVTYTTGAGAFGVATADFNGDGALDLAIANGSDNNVSVFLQTLPVGLNPASLSFGNQALTTSSTSQAVVLTNTSGSPVTFMSIDFTGADNGNFLQTNNCGASVANNGSCTINVTFSPLVSGPLAATLTITDSATNSPQTLAVSGTGTGSAPLITSATNAAFTVGVAGTFTVTTTGSPAPSLNETGSLPSGVTFTDNGIGTATIAGTPANGSGGSYVLTITAHNGIGSDSTQTFTLTVANSASISQAFGAATIVLNASTSLTFTITNSNSNVAFTGVAFTDTLPSGLIVATSNNLVNTCSGTASAVAGSSTVSLSAGTIAVSSSCTVSINVTGTTSGVKSNSVQVSATQGGTGNTSNASLTVISPAVIAKNFGVGSIPMGGSTTLSFSIQNNNASSSLSGVAFSDTLPAGLVISSPNGLTGSCTGSVTAVQATNVISFSPTTIVSSGSCAFTVNVSGSAAGQQNNLTSAITSTEGGSGNTASASVNVVAPPTIGQAFAPVTIALNGTSTVTFTVTNPAANTVAEAGVAFSDTLPTGLVIATPNGLSNTCGGTATAVAGSTSLSLTGGTLATNTSCTVVVNVTGNTSGLYSNISGAVSSSNGGTGNSASANLTVASPPIIAQAFGAASIPVTTTTSLTFTVTNPNSGVGFTGLAFADTLPGGLIVSTSNNLVSNCSGSAVALPGSSAVSLSAGTLAASGTCTVSLSVTGSIGGVKNNSVQVSATQGGTGNTSNATIAVVAPPTFAINFSVSSVPLGGSALLAFTVLNGNTTITLTGIDFTDMLPAGLVISSPSGIAGTCGGGTITAVQGTAVASLTGATIGPQGDCVFSVNVTGTGAGPKINTAGAITSVQGGTGSAPSASINVIGPPLLSEAFVPTSVVLNGTSTLTFTITNPAANTAALTGLAFSDALPGGLVVATPAVLSDSCGGTALAAAGSSSVSLTGGSVAANSSCTVVVNITGTTSGPHANVSGAVAATNGGTGNTASAILTVAGGPTASQAFGAATIPLNGATSLTVTISNPNAGFALSGLAFTDSLPTGLAVATPSNLASTCGAAAMGAAGSSSVSLSAGTLAASSACSVSFNVTGTIAGVKNNPVQASSTEGGASNTSNASITVIAPPTIAKAFGVTSLPVSSSTSLSFTVQNLNATSSLSNIAFSDTLPAGLVVATPNGLSNSCGGGTITAVQATSVVMLSGATLASSGSCVFSVNVSGAAAGQQNNTTAAITSNEGGTGGTASANVNVVAAPVLAETFTPTTISLNSNSMLTFTITNPSGNTVALSGVTVSDTLPSGLVIATPNGILNSCGGAPSAQAGTATLILTGGSVATAGSCTIAINVTGTAAGQLSNVSSPVSSANGGTGNTASAILSVAAPASIAQAFGGATIPMGTSTSLTFTISNPNAAIAFTGLAFTDSLPAGLVVATQNNLASTCSGNAIAAAGSSTVTLSAGTLAVSASCAVSLNVTGSAAGVKNNSAQISSTPGGTGNTASASLTVIAPPVLSQAFGSASVPIGGSASLSFTVQNSSATSSLTGVAFSDTLPAGLIVSTPSVVAGSCGGGSITAVQATSVITLTGATIAPSGSCIFSVNVTGTAAGQQNNTTGAVTSANGGTGNAASANMAVVAPPVIAQAFGSSAVALGGSTTLAFTITNPAANTVAEAGVAFSDTLPAGLVIATPSGLSDTCGGTATGTAGFATISLAAASAGVGASCTVVVNVTGAAAGQYTNVSGTISSTNGGTGNSASANLTVANPPSISEVFGASSLALGASTSLSFTIANPNSGVALAGVAFTDSLPAGLVVSTPNGLNGTCGSGAISAAADSQIFTLSGGTVGTSASCMFSLNVTAIAAGSQVNTTSMVTAANGGSGNMATASINVLAPLLSLAISHTGNFFQGEAGAAYVLTVTNTGVGPTLGAVTVTDTLPAGLTATAISGSGWNCNLGTVTCTRSDALAALSSYPPITVTVSVAANAPANVTDSAALVGGGELNQSNSSSSNVTTITLPPDFAVAATLSSDTIRAGQSASYSFTISPLNNNFTNAISLTVSGLPVQATFVFAPSAVTPGANSADATLVVTTAAGDPYVAGVYPTQKRNGAPLFAMLISFLGLLLSGIGFRGRRANNGWILAATLLVCVGLGIYGCTGVKTNFQYLGTPAGTYTVIVTGTSGSLQHSMPVTLVVQP